MNKSNFPSDAGHLALMQHHTELRWNFPWQAAQILPMERFNLLPILCWLLSCVTHKNMYLLLTGLDVLSVVTLISAGQTDMGLSNDFPYSNCSCMLNTYKKSQLLYVHAWNNQYWFSKFLVI